MTFIKKDRKFKILSFEIVCEKDIPHSLIEQLKIEVKKSIEVVKKEYNNDYQWICLSFVDEKKIQSLNEKFLHHLGSTDVLSFPYHQSDQKVEGDVIFCYQYVYCYFLDHLNGKGKKLNWYFYETILHGILHLFGLTHDYSEISLQKIYQHHTKILNQINIQWEVIDEFISKMD